MSIPLISASLIGVQLNHGQAHPIQGLNVQTALNEKQFDNLCDVLRKNSNISGVVILPNGKSLTCFFKMGQPDIQSLLQKAQPGKDEILSTVLNTGTTSIKAGIYASHSSSCWGARVGFTVSPNENSPNKMLTYGLIYKVIGDRNTKQSEHGENSTIRTQESTYFHTANTPEEIRDCGDNAYIECMYKVHE